MSAPVPPVARPIDDQSPSRAPVAGPVLVAGSTPYAWPWDGALEGDRLALVLAGNDVTWPRIAPMPDPVAHRLALAIASVRAAGGIVVRTAHPSAAARGVLVGSEPAPRKEGAPEGATATDERDHVVHAAGIDGFYGSPLDALLRAHGRDQLVLAGWGLEGPVHSTMRTANDQGYECLLLTDAVSAVTTRTRAPALSMVTMSGGIFGALGTTAALGAALASLTPPVPSPSSPRPKEVHP